MIGPAEIEEMMAEYEEAVTRFAGTLNKSQARLPEEVPDRIVPASGLSHPAAEDRKS